MSLGVVRDIVAILLLASLPQSLGQSCTNGDLRLRDGSSHLEGRIELCDTNNQWGTVCHDRLDPLGTNGPRASTVACRQLGFSDQGATIVRGPRDPMDGNQFGEGTGPILLDNVLCNGTETALLDCPHTGSDCGHDEDAGVICLPADCTQGSVRLVNGAENEGRVEVCVNQTWGTVSASTWEKEEAMVVCRQLGFSGATATAGISFGMGIGPILSIQCDGSESSFTLCTIVNNDHNYDHSNDAGISCSSSNNNQTTSSPTTTTTGTMATTTMQATEVTTNSELETTTGLVTSDTPPSIQTTLSTEPEITTTDAINMETTGMQTTLSTEPEITTTDTINMETTDIQTTTNTMTSSDPVTDVTSPSRETTDMQTSGTTLSSDSTDSVTMGTTGIATSDNTDSEINPTTASLLETTGSLTTDNTPTLQTTILNENVILALACTVAIVIILLIVVGIAWLSCYITWRSRTKKNELQKATKKTHNSTVQRDRHDNNVVSDLELSLHTCAAYGDAREALQTCVAYGDTRVKNSNTDPTIKLNTCQAYGRSGVNFDPSIKLNTCDAYGFSPPGNNEDYVPNNEIIHDYETLRREDYIDLSTFK